MENSFAENFSWTWFDMDLIFNTYEYQRPFFLYLALLVPLVLIAFGVWRMFKKTSQELELLQEEYVFSFWTLFGLVPWFFFFSSISLILFSLARPQKANEIQKTYLEGIDIALVLDISGSMVQGTDIEPNRLVKTIEIASDFVSKRENDNIGLVVFSGQAFAKAPLTQDKNVLKEIIQSIRPEDVQVSGTSIGNGCALGVSLLKDAKGKSRIMILLSDGANQGGDVSPEEAAKLAETFGIKIYTIGVGAPITDTFWGSVFGQEVDFTELQNIANITGGKFYQATSGIVLESIFNEIDQLERTKIDEERYKFKSDFYHIYIFWAIVFLLIFILLRGTFLVGMHRE